MANRERRVTTIHGHTLEDDFHWLRDRTDPDVLRHLEAENAHTEEVMAPTKPLQELLYAEMLGRIKQTDLSVPTPLGEHLYYSRTEEGQQYPRMCRRKGSMESPEEVLLDLNALAQGHPYLGIGAFVVSDDGRWLAYSVDTTGYRQFTLHVKDLETGAAVGEPIERTGTVVWAADNITIFFSTVDAV
jgi:oligopeptidase B